MHLWGSEITYATVQKIVYTEVRGASSIIIIIQMRFVTRAFLPQEKLMAL